MTRDELVEVLEVMGSGGSKVVIEGCCGHCYQEPNSLQLDEEGTIVVGERP